MSISPPCHNRTAATSDSWISPPALVTRLGPFDLDPCACIPQPFRFATRQFTIHDDGLAWPWAGLVYMNPPYGSQTKLWLAKLAHHNNGVALVFARTETRMFFEHVWPKASAILFLKGRLTFCEPNGRPAKKGHNSGGPSCLISYGREAARRLQRVRDLGALLRLAVD